MKQMYAFLAVIILFVLINVSFSSSSSEKHPVVIEAEQLVEQDPSLYLTLPIDSLDALLIQAIWDKDQSTIELVLKQGVDVNQINSGDGYAPLHWAVERGFAEIVSVLIAHGADVNVMTSGAIGKDRSALHIAAESGNSHIVSTLLASGADVHAKTAYQETPLHGVRLFVKNIEVIAQLIEAGADINAETVFGSTPLHSASMLGAADVVALLIEKGAAVDTANKRGLTPLHHAAQHGHAEVVDLLLQSPTAQLDAQTRNGDTALHLAAKKGYLDIVDKLLKAGANPLAENKFGKSPLAEALDRSLQEVVELLSNEPVAQETGF